MREAIAVDKNDGKAYATLGLNLIRGGDDDARRGRAEDARGRRTSSTSASTTRSNLYEKDIPTDYVTVEGAALQHPLREGREGHPRALRAAHARRGLGLDGEALRLHPEDAGLHRALRRHRSSFSIRTSGLPNVGIQGVCFGKTLAAMSPQRRRPSTGATCCGTSSATCSPSRCRRTTSRAGSPRGSASTRPSSAGPSGSARRTRRSSPPSRPAASRPSTASTAPSPTSTTWRT